MPTAANMKTMEDVIDRALARAMHLLAPDEKDLPTGVLNTIAFMERHGLWYVLSRNPKVFSCRDAASRRYRLGYQGIPLSDELRSYLMEGFDDTGGRHFVLLHCRGDMSIEFERIKTIPGLKSYLLRKADLKELDENSTGYGLINPFSANDIFSDNDHLLQVFDPSIEAFAGETRTMMTNSGDRTWAIEFNPSELVLRKKAFGAIVHKISQSETSSEVPVAKPIGILTGNAPESGVLLWQKINRKYRDERSIHFRGDISYPNILINSLPAMGWSMEIESRSELLFPELKGAVLNLVNSGAKSIAFACNTTQVFADRVDRVLENTGSDFVGLPRAVEEWIDLNSDKSIFVVGVGYVTKNTEFSAFPMLHNKSNITLPNEKQTKFINKLAFEVKKNGVNSICYQKFRSLVRQAGADVLLILLTEISMILEKYPRSPLGSVEIVDALDLYADTILNASEMSTESAESL